MKQALALVAVLVLATAVLAGSLWWDDRLDGQYLAGYDGAVIYDVDVLQAPISMPEPAEWYLGTVLGTGDTLTFTDAYGNATTGSWHAETGCYLTSTEFGQVVVGLCYDGAVSVDLWYGTLVWDGQQGVLAGPWLYHVYITVPSGTENGRQRFERHEAQLR